MKTEIIMFLQTLDFEQLIEIYNDIQDDPTHCIYHMSEFNSVYEQCSALEITELLKDSQFSANDMYFYKDENDKLISFSFADEYENPIFLQDIADYMITNKETFGYSEIWF